MPLLKNSLCINYLLCYRVTNFRTDKTMKNKLVVKDNALIDASFNLSLVEQRLMLLGIVQARELPELTPDTPIEIQALAYSKQYHVDESSAYKNLAYAAKTLKRREFSYNDRYKDHEAISVAGWVNKITYVKSAGMVVAYFSAEVITMISRLESQFTQYYLDQVSEFDSKYSIRLYELLMKWMDAGKTEKYTIEVLRAKLGLALTEYKTMSLFKVNVLERAIKEITKKSDLIVKYEQFRTGRSITHIQFKVGQKRVIKSVEDPQEFKFKLKPKQIELFARKLAYDSVFGSKYAVIGETLENFEIRLSSELENVDICRTYADHLIRLGYSEPKKKILSE